MKILYIIAGANGSGKTTFAKELLKVKNLVWLNADEIKFNENVTDIKAGKLFLQRLNDNLDKNNNILIESTISGKYIFDIVKKAKEKKYVICFYYLYISFVEENIERVKIRFLSKIGHNVPENDIIRRYSRSIKNFCKLKELVDSWEILVNNDEFELVANNETIYDEEIYNEIRYKCDS